MRRCWPSSCCGAIGCAREDVQPGQPRYDIAACASFACFTTHTPVDAGHDRFPYDALRAAARQDFDSDADLKQLAGNDRSQHDAARA